MNTIISSILKLKSDKKSSVKPKDLPFFENNIPLELKQNYKWVNWRWCPQVEEGKIVRWNKPPVCEPGGQPTSIDNGISFQEAKKHSDRVGVILSSNLVGIDIDDCIDEQGRISDLAINIIKRIGSYTEISPSITGIKILTLSNERIPNFKNTKLKIEVYNDRRYFTITSLVVNKQLKELRERTEEIVSLVNEYKPEETKITQPQQTVKNAANFALSPSSTNRKLMPSDVDLLRQIANSSNYRRFKMLWNGIMSEYNDDHSSADLAFCSILAFYTKDSLQIDRIMANSGLYRDKWNRQDYKKRTITKALQQQTTSFSNEEIEFFNNLQKGKYDK